MLQDFMNDLTGFARRMREAREAKTHGYGEQLAKEHEYAQALEEACEYLENRMGYLLSEDWKHQIAKPADIINLIQRERHASKEPHTLDDSEIHE